MANTVVLKLVFALVVCMAVTATYGEAEVPPCIDHLMKGLDTCLSYLQSGGAVPETCCDGLHSLYAAGNDTPDARAAAKECLKEFLSGVSGINEDNAKSLPGKCGISV